MFTFQPFRFLCNLVKMTCISGETTLQAISSEATSQQRRTTNRYVSSMSTQQEASATDNEAACKGFETTRNTRLDFTSKRFDATKISKMHSGQTDEAFSENQRDIILGDLRTFGRPDGLKITNCIFREDHVEICYLFQDSSDHNRGELRQQLADHLKLNSKLIKMTKLRAKPIYTKTSIRPGEIAIIDPQGPCKIGAFVEVEGKGNHALVSGHGKSQGDVLFYPNGHLFGVINVSLQPSLQPTANENWCGYYKDVALARLENQVGYIAQVVDGMQGPIGLMAQPIYATNNMMVRRFTRDWTRGRIDSKDYVILDSTYNIAFRLISVVSEDGGPIHVEGESGILIVTAAPVNGEVQAVGILVQLCQMFEDNEEHTMRFISLAVPLQANFDALRSHSYCNGAAIRFLN